MLRRSSGKRSHLEPAALAGLWYAVRLAVVPAALVMPAALLAGCSGSTTPDLGTVHVVQVGPNNTTTFLPATLSIKVGDSVRWEWQTSGHSVVSGTDGIADSNFCSPNDLSCTGATVSNSGTAYQHTFNAAGTFPYFCSVHFGPPFNMTGTITAQ